MKLVLYFVPQRRAAQRLLDLLRDIAAVAVEPQPERHVAVDAHRERIRLLENHPDVAAHRDRIDPACVNVLAAEQNLPFEAEAPDEVIHPVDTSKSRALAASGRANKSGDGVPRDFQGNVAKRLELAVIEFRDLAVDYCSIYGGV